MEGRRMNEWADGNKLITHHHVIKEKFTFLYGVGGNHNSIILPLPFNKRNSIELNFFFIHFSKRILELF